MQDSQGLIDEEKSSMEGVCGTCSKGSDRFWGHFTSVDSKHTKFVNVHEGFQICETCVAVSRVATKSLLSQEITSTVPMTCPFPGCNKVILYETSGGEQPIPSLAHLTPAPGEMFSTRTLRWPIHEMIATIFLLKKDSGATTTFQLARI